MTTSELKKKKYFKLAPDGDGNYLIGTEEILLDCIRESDEGTTWYVEVVK